MPQITAVVTINEATLVRVFLLILLGRRFSILEARSIFHATFNPILEGLSQWLLRKGWAVEIDHIAPDTEFQYLPVLASIEADVFNRTEHGINKHFKFDSLTSSRYSFCLKQVTCGYMGRSFPSILRLEEIDSKIGANVTYYIDSYVALAYEFMCGQKLQGRVVTSSWFHLPCNILLSLILLVKSIGAAARRITLKATVRHYDICAFYTTNIYFGMMIREILDSPRQCLVIFGSKKLLETDAKQAVGCDAQIVHDGVCSPGQFLEIVAFLVRDILHLLKLSWSYQPDHALQAMQMPVYRATIRMLMNKSRFQYCLTGQDYNVEHILRKMEFAVTGTVSLGLNQGLPVPTGRDPHLIYIDYDVYYTYGVFIYKHFLSNTCSPSMVVRGIGGFSLPRDVLHELRSPEYERPKDFIFFASPMATIDDIAKVAFKVMESFPDRRMYIKVKGNAKRRGGCRRLLECLDEMDDARLIETEEDSYQLMRRASYAIGGPTTTIITECLHYGLKTFVADLRPDLPNCYRAYPGLCVDSAEAIIESIQAMESGAADYPWANYAELTDLSNRIVFDVMRADMGLPPKELPTGICRAPAIDCVPANGQLGNRRTILTP